MSDIRNINWYPGHMNKAKKQMIADLNLVELIIEIVDARCPLSSRNPDIDRMCKNKYRMVLLNKADLADKNIGNEWKKYFEDKGISVLFLNSKNKEGLRNVLPKVKELCAERIERNLKRGIKNQPIRAMVVGIPNVGKSTFINAFCGKNIAKTGDKPGVTKGKQWIKVNSDLELLDTPGILWPKFEDANVGLRLALIGSINDNILIPEELAGSLLNYFKKEYPDILKKFSIENELFETNISEMQFVTYESLMLDKVAGYYNCLKKGGSFDYVRASVRLLDDFRGGKLGRITLERP